MLMNLKLISLVNKKLKFLIKNKEVIDLIIFGSSIKGKAIPRDIDIAIILSNPPSKELHDTLTKMSGFHISIITINEFFINAPNIVNTLLREGYSVKNKKLLAENFKFLNRVLFKYDLTSLSASMKVKIVNILRGKNKSQGLIEKNNGEWIANQVFLVPISVDGLFEDFFNNFKIKYKKFHVLIH